MVNVLTSSEVGGNRVNEDAFLVRPHPADPACWLVALADGQGGRAGGGRASQVATTAVIEAAAAQPPSRLRKHAAWPTLLRHADHAVSADPEAGFTTLIAFCVADGQVVGASSGDSAVVAIAKGTAVEMATKQVKNPPVGSGDAVFVPFACRLVTPWLVLAMSDGVWKYAGWERVVAATHERGEALIATLQQAARVGGTGPFPDDFTVVLLESAS